MAPGPDATGEHIHRLVARVTDQYRKAPAMAHEPTNHSQPETLVHAYLNDLLKLDPDAMQSLLRIRVQANQLLEEHPHVVVRHPAEGLRTLGVLGVLNGIMTVLGLPRMAVVVDDADPDHIVRFGPPLPLVAPRPLTEDSDHG